MELHFHSERVQPLSDILRNNKARVFLTSKTPAKLHISIMTSRGLAHADTVCMSETPYALEYEPPWGRDWSVLQIQAVEPKTPADEPYTVTLRFEKIDRAC